MSARRGAAGEWMEVLAAAIMLVTVIDLLTNTLDTSYFSWDFRYYLDMARRGLEPPLASPFAYRYATPLLARSMLAALGISPELAFGIIARVSAVAQLLGVFFLARWHSRSRRGAWVAMLGAAVSLFQVKYLLFDTFRPDHLAYPLLLLQVWLALTGRFWPLWIATIIGCQIREFNAVPLVAYVCAALLNDHAEPGEHRRSIALLAGVSALGLAAALIVPRVLIPVAEDFQFVSLTAYGVLRALLAPLILARDANFVYALIAYALPVLMLASPGTLRESASRWPRFERAFFGSYASIVLVMGFFGGTDFQRFMTYLLPLLALGTAGMAAGASNLQVLAMLAATSYFNRIWLPFPNADLDQFLDFFSGFGTRFNSASLHRILELTLLLIAGHLLRLRPGAGRLRHPDTM